VKYRSFNISNKRTAQLIAVFALLLALFGSSCNVKTPVLSLEDRRNIRNFSYAGMSSEFKLLFMDEHDICDVWGRVKFVSNPLQPMEGVEGAEMEPLMSVEHSDGSWIMYGMRWVGGELPRKPRPANHYIHVRAQTVDGYAFSDAREQPWNEPAAGLEEVFSNIFHQKTMAYNAAEKEWLLLYSRKPSTMKGQNIQAFKSKDGLNFTMIPKPVYYGHDALHVTWDPRSKDYLCYQVAYQPWKKKYQGNIEGRRRVVVIKRSSDGIKWYPECDNTVTNKVDRKYLLTPNQNDPPDLEFYWFTPFWYADRFIGMMMLHQDCPEEVNPGNGEHCPNLATEWMISRDGISWSRPYQDQYLGLEPDQTGIYANGRADVLQCSPIVINGEIQFMGRGKIKEDRIGCVAASANAEFSSQSFQMSRVPLFLNATALWRNKEYRGGHLQNRQAYIMVELRDKHGKVIEGYEKKNCYFQDVDETDLPLSWKGKTGKELAGKKVQLRFYIRNARVYAVSTK